MRQQVQKAFLIAALGVGLSSLAAYAAPTKDALLVKTDKGGVAGKMSADGQVRDFLGIPYAAPPVGKLRWQAPQPAPAWKDVRQATSFGSHCVQPKIFNDIVFRDPGPSEDCLTLNVWTPTAAGKKDAKLPVMVWIHGGGFVVGASSEPRQDGERLAHKGVIVVSMNYRLGIFGFFASSELAAESSHHAAGNYGLLDQRAALAWVQKNIQAFGGDPNNVTVFGESAGSMSVSAQMASPLSQGLFARAMGESGGAMGNLRFPSLATSKKMDEADMRESFGTTQLKALRALSAEKLLAAPGARNMGSDGFGPNIDGYFLPENVEAMYAAGKQAHIPLLAGWNKDEGAQQIMFSPVQSTVKSLQAMAQQEFAAQAPAFLRAYTASNNTQALRVSEDFAGDKFIAYSTWLWLENQAKTGAAPVYRYHFDEPSPVDVHHPVAAGTFHSDDIEYVFGNLDAPPGAKRPPADRKVSEHLQRYLTKFAKTGNPNGPNLPHWPVYRASTGWQVLHLTGQPQAPTGARPDHHRDRYLFLQQNWK